MKKEIDLFNSTILKLNYDINWNKIKPIAENLVNIEEQDHLEHNAVTSYKNQKNPTHNLLELKDFYEFITPYVKNYVYDILEYPDDNELMIQNAWFSRYDSNGYIKEHTHPDSVAVVCLYIQKDENESNTEFKNPLHKHRLNLTNSKNESWLWKSINTKTNDIIIFDSVLPHRSQPNNSKNERWILTTNFGFKKTKSII